VTLDVSDTSLLGRLGNGINNYPLDTPEYYGGPLGINTKPRSGRPEFNDTRLPLHARLSGSWAMFHVVFSTVLALAIST
jgi:hypothetical protein